MANAPLEPTFFLTSLRRCIGRPRDVILRCFSYARASCGLARLPPLVATSPAAISMLPAPGLTALRLFFASPTEDCCFYILGSSRCQI